MKRTVEIQQETAQYYLRIESAWLAFRRSIRDSREGLYDMTVGSIAKDAPAVRLVLAFYDDNATAAFRYELFEEYRKVQGKEKTRGFTKRQGASK